MGQQDIFILKLVDPLLSITQLVNYYMLEVTVLRIETIYVKLLNEGTDVWRPVEAKKIDSDIYEISSNNKYNNDLEEWQFPPNSKVICVSERKNDKDIKIAIRKYKDHTS
jgi:hypothetical protein